MKGFASLKQNGRKEKIVWGGGGREGERKKEKRKKPSHAVGELMNAILVIYHTKEWKAKTLILKTFVF